jgi:hypothetical protein
LVFSITGTGDNKIETIRYKDWLSDMAKKNKFKPREVAMASTIDLSSSDIVVDVEKAEWEDLKVPEEG